MTPEPRPAATPQACQSQSPTQALIDIGSTIAFAGLAVGEDEEVRDATEVEEAIAVVLIDADERYVEDEV